MAYITSPSQTRTGLMARLSGTAAALRARIARYRLFRATLAEMQQLSDRELADLGLSRSLIRRAAYEAAYG